MSLLSPPASPRPSHQRRGLFYLAFAASVLGLWSIFFWYHGIYREIEAIREERNAAINIAQARAFEQKSQAQELQRLKDRYGEVIEIAKAQIAELNSTAKATGYANFPGCQLPGAEDVVIVIKTGATEAYKTLPIHFATTLTHAPNHLIFSDHNQTIGPYQIQDALDEVSPDLIHSQGEFQIYRDQKQYLSLGQSAAFLEFAGGWELDKYKNLPMLTKAWKQRPDAKWYFFMDGDSYVVMANLLPYLQGLDHTKKLYLGGAALIADLPFGHGGTGYVVSQGLMKYIMKKEPELARKYEETAKDNCCGDYVLARAFADHDVLLSDTSRQFQGDPFHKISMDEEKFCQPIITLHHMRPADVGAMWEFEKRVARPGKYVLFRDVFEELVWPHLWEERRDWDNLSGDQGEVVEISLGSRHGNMTKEEKQTRVFTKCREACQGKERCMQFRTWKEECKVHEGGVMLGYKVPVSWEDNEDFRSGWMMERVEKLKKREGCEQPGKGWPQNVVDGA